MANILKLAALIIIAAIGAFALRALFVAASRPGPATPPPMENVRAAAADLPDGLLLRDSDLTWKSVPRDQVPAGTLVQGQAGADDLKGDLLRRAVRTGTPLGPADVISPNAPGFLAAALKPGMRAISVAIDDVSGNAGLIQPGDYVDVLLTQQIAAPGGAPVAPERAVESETIVNRVRVLAVGSAFQRPKDDAAQPNSRARTVTFEVTSRTAQVITVAAHLGSLSLALRSFATRDRNPPNPDGPTEPQAPPVWAGDVSRALRSAEPSGTTSTRTSTSARPVIVYRGSKEGNTTGVAAFAAPIGVPGLPPLPPGRPAAAPAEATRGAPAAPAQPAA
jgi:pilus assembly protein CpaB